MGKPPSENFLLQKRIDDAFALQAAVTPTLSPILESPALHAADEVVSGIGSEAKLPKTGVTESFPLINDAMQGNTISTSST